MDWFGESEAMLSYLFDKQTVRRAIGLRREILFAIVLTLAAILYVIIGALSHPTADGKDTTHAEPAEITSVHSETAR